MSKKRKHDKRSLNKMLKENGVFSKFCVTLAGVFGGYPNPREKLKEYYGTVLSVVGTKYSSNKEYVETVKSWNNPSSTKAFLI